MMDFITFVWMWAKSMDGYYYHTSTSEYQRLCLEVEKKAASAQCARR